MNDGRLALGVDIGGTKIAAGIVDESGAVLARDFRPTPNLDGAELLDAIVDMSAGLIGQTDVIAVGVGAAGWVGRDGTVRFAPHLPWRDEPVGAKLSERLGLAVVVENDADAGGWAESRFGAARGVQNALFVAVGTGIGGALITCGDLYRGFNGQAGEIGHQIAVRDGLPCMCGSRGCWEQYASGRALTRRARESGFDVDAGAPVMEAAHRGDQAAIDLFEEVGGWLGHGIASLVAVLDPEIVVVGGGVSAAGDLLLNPARAVFEASITGGSHRHCPAIVPASLGPDAALVGAAERARQS